MNNPSIHRKISFGNRLALAAMAVTVALISPVAHAAVIVTLTDNDGVPNQAFGEPGMPFTVTVTLDATEPTTGLTYFLQDASGSAGNVHFQITGRDTTGSTYSFLTEPSNGVVTSTPNSLLDPSNNIDLGGGVADLNSPNPAGSYFVANITFLTLPTTAPGVYNIQLTPNSVAAGAGPEFTEIPVTSFQYTVTTPVPEPATASLLMIAGLILGARMRSRRD